MDVWAAGCMFIELLMGRPIFRGDNAVQVLHHIISYIGLPPAALLQRSLASFVFKDKRLYPDHWVDPKYFTISADGDVHFNGELITDFDESDDECMLNPCFKDLLNHMLCYIHERWTAEECVAYMHDTFFTTE